MKDLKNILDEIKDIDGYRILNKSTDSYELFFVHEKLETVRNTSTSDTTVTVYKNHGDKTGDSSFSVYQSMTEEDIRKKADLASKRAMLVSNEPYELPEGGELSAAVPSDVQTYEPVKLGAMIADAVFTAECEPGCSINALEIFIYNDTVRVQNSRGVDKTQTVSRVMIEAIPTFTDEDQSVEIYEDCRFTAFDKEKLQKEISGKLREVYDRSKASKPGKELDINVILRTNEIRELVWTIADNLNYASVYTHANLHETGDVLQNGDCDKMTLTLRSVIDGSEYSAYFDDDGLDMTDTCVVKDGAVCGYYGANRFGQYLKVKPSGDLGCIEMNTGTCDADDMKKEPYIECVSMSGLQVDLYNDYIGGEIRLAYYFDGEKTVPVTGITMSGSLSSVLSGLRMSTTSVVSGSYKGPGRILLKGVKIL